MRPRSCSHGSRPGHIYLLELSTRIPEHLFVYGAPGLVYADYSESALGVFGDKKNQELGTR